MNDSFELIRDYDGLGERYRFIHYSGPNLIEIQQLVSYKWWQRIFKTNGQTNYWKCIYRGFPTVIEKCLETYQLGLANKELRNKKYL